jgi:calcium/calmodulin-dependent protein kinase I
VKRAINIANGKEVAIKIIDRYASLIFRSQMQDDEENALMLEVEILS